jgi:hypothetical protein
MFAMKRKWDRGAAFAANCKFGQTLEGLVGGMYKTRKGYIYISQNRNSTMFVTALRIFGIETRQQDNVCRNRNRSSGVAPAP